MIAVIAVIAVLQPMIGGMPMAGGSAASMAWTRMPAQTWLGAAASFLGMWVAMMAAMMLPSMAPVLWRYRQAIGATSAARRVALTALVGGGYLFVWAVFGTMIYPLGAALTALESQLAPPAGAVAIAIAAVVLVAAALQFTTWKSHHLACWRTAPKRGRSLPANARSAWRHGLRLGVHCCCCSAGPTMLLLVLGVMDLRVMSVVTIAITAERLAPAGERVTRALGVVGIAAGLLLMARAAWPG